MQSLTCVLMDFDDYNPDDEIGRCVLPIRDLQPEETTTFWLDVDLHAEGSAVDEKACPKNGPCVPCCAEILQFTTA